MLVKTFTLFCFISCALALDGYKILQVTPSTESQGLVLKKLSENTNYDFLQLRRTEARILVSPQHYTTLTNLFKINRIAYKVINDNVLEDVIKEKNENDILRSSAPEQRMSLDRYYSHEEMNENMENMQRRFPNRATVKLEGYSYEGRELKSIRITNGDGIANKSVIFIDGGMHAREWIAPVTANHIIYQLLENFDANKHLLEHNDWLIYPMINPDGYMRSYSNKNDRMWRKTTSKQTRFCEGVDPNRNFDVCFGCSGTSNKPCSDIYRGPKAFSENETITLRDMLLSYKDNCAYLTLHSYGRYCLYPYGYDENVPAPNADEHEDLCLAASNAIEEHNGKTFTIGTSADALYPAAGGSDDFALARAQCEFAITMELAPGSKNGFDPQHSEIRAIVEESWIGIKAMMEKYVSKYN